MDLYDRISQRIDAINDIVWENVGDEARGKLLEQEAEILKEVGGGE